MAEQSFTPVKKLLNQNEMCVTNKKQSTEPNFIAFGDCENCQDDKSSSVGSLTMTLSPNLDLPVSNGNDDQPNFYQKYSDLSISVTKETAHEYHRLYECFNTLCCVYNDFINISTAENGQKLPELMSIEAILSPDLLSAYNKYKSGPNVKENNRSSVELCNVTHLKLWKRRYCLLLDAVDAIYKDLQCMDKLNEVNDGSDKVANLLELVETICGSKTHQIIKSFKETDNTVSVSCAFIEDIVAQCRVLRGEAERQRAVRDRLSHILSTAREQRAKLKLYVNNLRQELDSLIKRMKESKVVDTEESDIQCCQPAKVEPVPKDQPKIQTTTIQLSNVEKMTYEQKIVDLERVLREEEVRRKRLHNTLQQMIGNIRVFCRIRPIQSTEQQSFIKLVGEDKMVVVLGQNSKWEQCNTGRLYRQKQKQQMRRHTQHYHHHFSQHHQERCFIFDHVFGPDSSQTDVYRSAVEGVVTSCVDGYNVCIMAYGQTGAGKTHTMMGSEADPGVNRRAVRRLLELCTERSQRKRWRYRLFVSMAEVYQEEVRDLLEDSAPVRILSCGGGDSDIHLQGLSQHEVTKEVDVLKCFSKGERNRAVGATLLNPTSSRSHLLVLLRVYGNQCNTTKDDSKNSVSSTGTLTLCDLAGSESASRSGATGSRLAEAACINRSLTALGRVFDSLRRGERPVYRETRLTHLLRPTLGGDAKCLLFVNVRSEWDHVDETMRAIHFGLGAMQVAPERAQQRTRLRKNLAQASQDHTTSTEDEE